VSAQLHGIHAAFRCLVRLLDEPDHGVPSAVQLKVIVTPWERE